MTVLTEEMVRLAARAKTLEDVKHLNCWGMDITDISVLSKLPNLEVLSLSVNGITSLKDIACCKKVTELYLRKNKIDNINEIMHLKHLPSLRILWISDNPFESASDTRLTILRNLPRLVKLDNKTVTNTERSEAMNAGRELEDKPTTSTSKVAAALSAAATTVPHAPLPALRTTNSSGPVLGAVLQLLTVLSKDELAAVSARIAELRS
eukprot:m.237888 g.237888  ORF g.237888 m.237888 type:complete len:208 (-) comp13212_c0_seq1:86-709(-)